MSVPNFSFLACLEVAEKFVVARWGGWVPSDYSGLPNRPDFGGEGPEADLFALQSPENGPKITKNVRISG